MKFKLGDRVTSKKTGLPAVGDVTGIIDAEYLMNLYKCTFSGWSKYYPDWSNKPCYFVLLSNPQRAVRLDEYLETLPNSTEEDYYREVPKTISAIYPESDLELL